jgi:hypothetical protein
MFPPFVPPPRSRVFMALCCSHTAVLVMILRLRQLCCHPKLILVSIPNFHSRRLFGDPFLSFFLSRRCRRACEESSGRVRRPNVVGGQRKRKGACAREESNGLRVGREVEEEVRGTSTIRPTVIRISSISVHVNRALARTRAIELDFTNGGDEEDTMCPVCHESTTPFSSYPFPEACADSRWSP